MPMSGTRKEYRAKPLLPAPNLAVAEFVQYVRRENVRVIELIGLRVVVSHVMETLRIAIFSVSRSVRYI